MHEDSGNTGSTDYPGPLGGNNISLFSQQIVTGVMAWGANNTMTIGYANSTTLARGIAAIDPQTMEILATWAPPDTKQTLSLGYLEYLLETDEILFTSQEGHVYLIRRDDEAERGTSFTTIRNIDLATFPSAIADGESLLNAMMDTAGSIWYTTGGIPGIGSLYAAQTSLTLGYITPDNQVHSIQMDGQTIENGIAVSNNTAYVVTGPTTIGTEGVRQVGYMLALASLPASGDTGSNGGVRTLWNATYDAGSTTKLGAITRGSGSTPALLGEDYVVITDNADGRINLQSTTKGPRRKNSCFASSRSLERMQAPTILQQQRTMMPRPDFTLSWLKTHSMAQRCSGRMPHQPWTIPTASGTTWLACQVAHLRFKSRPMLAPAPRQHRALCVGRRL